ncbi:hypothetical protein GCM10027275_10040 [Rhabdobacter roseus]
MILRAWSKKCVEVGFSEIDNQKNKMGKEEKQPTQAGGDFNEESYREQALARMLSGDKELYAPIAMIYTALPAYFS